MNKQQKGASDTRRASSLVALMKSMVTVKFTVPLALATVSVLATEVSAQPVEFSKQQQLLADFGKQVFFDESLSTPGNKQGCVSCHDPERGWTFPDSETNLGPVGNPGAHPHARGKIKPPTVAYASFVRHFQPCGVGAPPGGRWCGGMFWNGRAEGTAPEGTYPANEGTGVVSDSVAWEDLQLNYKKFWHEYGSFLGPLTDQALNPAQPGIEQNAGEKKVCQQVKTSKYKAMYQKAFGEPINCQSMPKNNPAYHVAFMRIALSLAAYQTSSDVNSFSSLRDLALYREFGCLYRDDPWKYANYHAYADYADEKVCIELGYLKKSDTWGQFPLAFVGLGLKKAEIRQINRGHDIFYGVESDYSHLNDGNPGPLRDQEAGPLSGNLKFTVGIDAQCWRCHSDTPGRLVEGVKVGGDDGTEPLQIYADQGYHSIGIPFNREIPNTVKGEVAGIIEHVTFGTGGGPFATTNPGAFRTPTLRENAKGEAWDFTKAFGHNGYFKSLAGIIHFYGTRDLKPKCEEQGIVYATEAEALENGCWPEPEFPDAVSNFGRVGVSDLYLQEEEAIAAYIRALSDTHIAKAP